MSQLHPAVIESTGLLPALRDLVEATRARGRFAITLNSDGWADDDRTGADELLLTTARELLTNVVKHAGAHHGQDRAPPRSRGRLAEGDRRRPWHGRRRSSSRLAEGHLALASRRIRIEAVGGALSIHPAEPHGTVAEVTVPAATTLPERASR